MNKAVATYIRKIQQKDNYTFTIIWHDSLQIDYRLSELQAECPCAACSEIRSDTKNNPVVQENLRAVRIYSVGRYALRIQFTSGCSMGIYDFGMLYSLIKGKR